MWRVHPQQPLEKIILRLFLETDIKAKENDFRALKDPARQVDMVYQHIKRLPAFQEIFRDSQDRKSNDLSTRWRTEGNHHYTRHKDYLAAQECYTKSIAFAETGSSFLALAYANRSAVLFEKKYYKQALEDISRALSSDYPENLRKKLEIRREKAEKLMHNQRSIGYYKSPPEIESKNPLISCASDAVEIQCNEKYGRHLIATRDIQVGEVISVENSFCHTIHSESRYHHCHQCLELCYNMIPCPGCVNALYCTEECLLKCYEQVHKYECRFPNVLLFSENNFMKLTLIGIDDTCKQENEESPNYVYRSDSFQEIMKLEMHDEPKQDYAFMCAAAMVAAIGFHTLKNDLEYTSKYSKNSDDDTLKRILYRSYLVNKYNTFDIGKNRLQLYNASRMVGIALYAFTSLYNHSCLPNCDVSHYGALIVTRAHAFIKKGEQITISYGYSYSTTPKRVRQAILRRYHLFDCDCRACENDWPTKENLEEGKSFPLEFEVKIIQYMLYDSNNKRLMNELLREGKQLLYALQKYQPCFNYLVLQDLISVIYKYQANKDVEF